MVMRKAAVSDATALGKASESTMYGTVCNLALIGRSPFDCAITA